MDRTMRQLAILLLLALLPPLLRAQNSTYCLSISYASVPSLVNDRKLTLNVAVGACSGVSVTADGAWIPSSYSSSTQAASFSTSGTAITILALNATAAGTGAASKASLYNNFHWAYSQTFDDTRQSQYDYAKPILDALGWKAGIAAVGSWIESGNSYYMTWAEVQALRADGWQVYNHTWDHPDPVACANFPTEFGQNQTAFLTELPGYHVSHVVYPYEVSTASCSGWPPNYIISGELGGSGYTHVDTVLGQDYTVPRNGLYGTDPTNIETVSAQAAADSRPSWVVCITHSVTQGSGAAADAYSTNQNALNTLYSYLGSNFGAAGNKSMWFAPSGEVMDYLFTRDNAVVSTCVAATPTPSPKLTASPSPSSTAEPSSTRSITPSSTPTATSTRTATPSASATPSATAEPSATSSSTPSSTATPTTSATEAQSTPSATAEASATRSSTATSTCSGTASPSATATSSASASPTPLSTASAAQSTPSATAKQSSTATSTASSSATPSMSASPTASQTLSASPSFSATAMASSSASATPTPSDTAEPSATRASTATSSPSPTLTLTASPSLTATARPSATASPTSSPSPVRSSGSLQILRALPGPDPNPQQVWIELSGEADLVTLRIWSAAYVLVASTQAGPEPRGWSALALPAGFSSRAANGVYFITVEAERQGQVARTKPLKCLILH